MDCIKCRFGSFEGSAKYCLGCAGWQEFGYNRKQQARQCVMIVIGSILMACIFSLL